MITKPVAKLLNQPWCSLAVIMATLLACTGYWLTHSDDIVFAASQEDGLLQTGTNILYMLCIVPALYYSFKDRRVFAVALILILFLLRENDLHKIYADQGFLKEPFYFNPHIPMGYKAWGLSMIAGLVVFCIYLARYIKPVWRGLRHWRVWAVSVTLTLITLCTAKSLDGLKRTLARVGVHIQPAYPTLVEESLELILPLLILLSLWQFLNYRDKGISAA